MGISVDLTSVESGGFKLLEPGIYNATVFSVEKKPSKSSDNDYLNWQFKLFGKGVENKRVFDITSLSPKALWRLKSTLAAIAPDMNLDGQINLELEELAGLPCRVKVGTDEYQGKEKNVVEEVMEPEGGSAGGVGDDFLV